MTVTNSEDAFGSGKGDGFREVVGRSFFSPAPGLDSAIFMKIWRGIKARQQPAHGLLLIRLEKERKTNLNTSALNLKINRSAYLSQSLVNFGYYE